MLKALSSITSAIAHRLSGNDEANANGQAKGLKIPYCYNYGIFRTDVKAANEQQKGSGIDEATVSGQAKEGKTPYLYCYNYGIFRTDVKAAE